MDSPRVRYMRSLNRVQENELNQKLEKLSVEANVSLETLNRNQSDFSKRYAEHLPGLGGIKDEEGTRQSQNAIKAPPKRRDQYLPPIRMTSEPLLKAHTNSPQVGRKPIPSYVENFRKRSPRLPPAVDQNAKRDCPPQESTKKHARTLTHPLENAADKLMPIPAERNSQDQLRRSWSEGSLLGESGFSPRPTTSRGINRSQLNRNESTLKSKYSLSPIKESTKAELIESQDVDILQNGTNMSTNHRAKSGKLKRKKTKPRIHAASECEDYCHNDVKNDAHQENPFLEKRVYRKRFRSLIRGVFDKLKVNRILEHWLEEAEERDTVEEDLFSDALRQELERCRYLRMPYETGGDDVAGNLGSNS